MAAPAQHLHNNALEGCQIPETSTIDFAVKEASLREAIRNRQGCKFLVEFIVCEACINTNAFRQTYNLIENVSDAMERQLLILTRPGTQGGLVDGGGKIDAICKRVLADFPDALTQQQLTDVHSRLLEELFVDPCGNLVENIREIVELYMTAPILLDTPTNPFLHPQEVQVDRIVFAIEAFDYYASSFPETNMDGTREDIAPVANEDNAPVANEDIAPVANEDIAPVANEDIAPVANEDNAPVANEDIAPVANEDNDPHISFGLMNEHRRKDRFILKLVMDELSKFYVIKLARKVLIPFASRRHQTITLLYQKMFGAEEFTSVTRLSKGHSRNIVVEFADPEKQGTTRVASIVVVSPEVREDGKIFFDYYESPNAIASFPEVKDEKGEIVGYKDFNIMPQVGQINLLKQTKNLDAAKRTHYFLVVFVKLSDDGSAVDGVWLNTWKRSDSNFTNIILPTQDDPTQAVFAFGVATPSRSPRYEYNRDTSLVDTNNSKNKLASIFDVKNTAVVFPDYDAIDAHIRKAILKALTTNVYDERSSQTEDVESRVQALTTITDMFQSLPRRAPVYMTDGDQPTPDLYVKLAWGRFASEFWSPSVVKDMMNTYPGDNHPAECQSNVREPNTWFGSWRVREELAQAILYAYATRDAISDGTLTKNTLTQCALFPADPKSRHLDALRTPTGRSAMTLRSTTILEAIGMPASVFNDSHLERDVEAAQKTITFLEEATDELTEAKSYVLKEKTSRINAIRIVTNSEDFKTCPSSIDYEKLTIGDTRSIIAGSLHVSTVASVIDDFSLVWSLVLSTMTSPRFPLGTGFDAESDADMEHVTNAVKDAFDLEVCRIQYSNRQATITRIKKYPTVKITITKASETVAGGEEGTMTRIVAHVTRKYAPANGRAPRKTRKNHVYHKDLEQLRLRADQCTTRREDVVANVFPEVASYKKRKAAMAINIEEDYVNKQIMKTLRKRMPFTIVSIDPPFFTRTNSLRKFMPQVFFGKRLDSVAAAAFDNDVFISEFDDYNRKVFEVEQRIAYAKQIGGNDLKFSYSPGWFSRYSRHNSLQSYEHQWTTSADGTQSPIANNKTIKVPRGAPVPILYKSLGGAIAEGGAVWVFLCAVLQTTKAQAMPETYRWGISIADRVDITLTEWQLAVSLILDQTSETSLFAPLNGNAALCDTNILPAIAALGWNGVEQSQFVPVFWNTFTSGTRNESISQTSDRNKTFHRIVGQTGTVITLGNLGAYIKNRNQPNRTELQAIESTNFFPSFTEKWKLVVNLLNSTVDGPARDAIQLANRRTKLTPQQEKLAASSSSTTRDDDDFKRWFSKENGTRTGYRRMQWVRMRNDVFEAVANDEADKDNAPFPTTASELSTLGYKTMVTLKTAIKFYYAMSRSLSMLKMTQTATENVENIFAAAITGRSKEPHFVGMKRAINRTISVMSCINDEQHTTGQSKTRHVFDLRSHLFGAGERGTGPGYRLRTTNQSSTDLLMSYIDKLDFGSKIPQIVAALKSPSEFAMYFETQSIFQSAVAEVIDWYLMWRVASSSAYRGTYKTSGQCDLNADDSMFEKPVSTQYAPTWKQLVRACEATTLLVCGETTMFDILYLRDVDAETKASVEAVEQMTNGIGASKNLFETPGKGQGDLDSFMAQAKRFSATFDKLVVNGVMRSIETAADRSFKKADTQFDITAQGAKRWLRCQYSKRKIGATTAQQFRDILNVADDFNPERSKLPEMFVEWDADHPSIKKIRTATGQTEEQINDAIALLETRYNEISAGEKTRVREERMDYNRRFFNDIIVHMKIQIEQVDNKFNTKHTLWKSLYNNWIGVRDNVWTKKDRPTLYNYKNGTWIEVFKHIESDLQEIDDPTSQQARQEDRLITELTDLDAVNQTFKTIKSEVEAAKAARDETWKEWILTKYKPVPLEQKDVYDADGGADDADDAADDAAEFYDDYDPVEDVAVNV